MATSDRKLLSCGVMLAIAGTLALPSPSHAGVCVLADGDGDPITEDTGGSTAGASSFACGPSNTAAAQDSAVAIGAFNTAGVQGTVAVGVGNSALQENAVAVGSQTMASGAHSVSVGNFTQATGLNSVVLGSWVDANNDGTAQNDFDTDGDGIFDISREIAQARGQFATAIGSAAAAIADRSAALGAGALAIAADSVALGSNSIADQANTISIGSVGSERRITNMAAGTQATDAVNLAQMQDGFASTLATANAYTDTAVATGGTQANAYTDNREAAIRTDMEAGDAQTLSAANAYTDSKFANFDFSAVDKRFENIERQLGRQDTRIDQIGAMSAAMMNMGTNISGTASTRGKLAVGAGFQGGEQAMSIGYGKRIGDRTSFSLSGAFSGSEKSAGIGFGVEL